MGVGRFSAELDDGALESLLGGLSGEVTSLGLEAMAAGQHGEVEVAMGLAPPGLGASLAHGAGWSCRAWRRIERQWGEGELAMACQRSLGRASTSSPTSACRN